jgi:hypothetical protein
MYVVDMSLRGLLAQFVRSLLRAPVDSLSHLELAWENRELRLEVRRLHATINSAREQFLEVEALALRDARELEALRAQLQDRVARDRQ